MIKTQSYNTFHFDKSASTYSIEEMEKMISDFIKNNGDLTLPILYYGNTYNILDFLSKVVGFETGFIKTLENKGILKIKKLFWDKGSNELSFKDGYDLKWFSVNKSSLVQELESLKNILPKSIYEVASIKNFTTRHVSKNSPAIVELLKAVRSHEVWQWSLNHFHDLGDFIKVDILKDPGQYIDLRHIYSNPASVNDLFFKEGLIPNKILQESEHIISDIIITFLKKNDIESIDRALKKATELEMNMPLIEGITNREAFFCYANSKEAAAVLLKNGITTESKKTKAHFMLLGGFKNEVIEYLLDNEKERSCILNVLRDKGNIERILSNSDDYLGLLVLIKEKTGLRFKGYNLLNYISEKTHDTYSEAKKQVDFLLSKSIEVDFNNLFCAKIVHDREEGLKKLRNYVKLGIIEATRPEFINAFLNYDFRNGTSRLTRIFYLYMSKTFSSVDFSKRVEDAGSKPVWWDINNINLFDYVLKNLSKEDLLSSSDTHTNFLTYFLNKVNCHNHKDINVMMEYFFTLINKHNLQEGLREQITAQDIGGNNILHYYLNVSKYENGRQLSKFGLSGFKTLIGDSFGELFTQKNKDGLMPIEILLKIEGNNLHKNIFLAWLHENKKSLAINYIEKTSNGNPLYIEIVECLNKSNKEDLAKEFLREGMHSDIEQRLRVGKEEGSSKLKILKV